MAVLVTGSAGYIGSHMVWELLDAGESVVVIDDLVTGFRWAVPSQFELVVGCIGDQDLVRTVMKKHDISSVIHFAGSVVLLDSVSDPLGYYLNNTVRSRSLIESAVQMGVKNFIFSSTTAVYGDPKETPVAEDATPAPMSPYGSSKLMTEIMLADTARAHDFRYSALRYFNVAGADPQGRTGQSTRSATHLIEVACETALGKRDRIDVFGTDYPTADGTCVRDYIHVKDLVRAHTSALHYLRNGGQSDIFNVGYSKGYSVLEVLDSVKRVSGAAFDVRLSPRRPVDPAGIVTASAKMRATLGWEPKHDDLDQVVRQALAWEDHLIYRFENEGRQGDGYNAATSPTVKVKLYL